MVGPFYTVNVVEEEVGSQCRSSGKHPSHPELARTAKTAIFTNINHQNHHNRQNSQNSRALTSASDPVESIKPPRVFTRRRP